MVIHSVRIGEIPVQLRGWSTDRYTEPKTGVNIPVAQLAEAAGNDPVHVRVRIPLGESIRSIAGKPPARRESCC